MKTIDALKITISKFPDDYARGRDAHAALAPYADATSLLAALGLSSSLSLLERDAIVLALITEHQRSSRPIWQALLLTAFEPMLANVRRRLIVKDDAEQRILLSFLDAIARISLAHPPSCLALHLRHATERGVFGTGAVSRFEPEIESLDELRKHASPDDLEAVVDRTRQTQKLFAEIESLFGDEAQDVLEVLVTARTGREALVALVEKNHPSISQSERNEVYARLQRLRRRALTHLQNRFGREALIDRDVA